MSSKKLIRRNEMIACGCGCGMTLAMFAPDGRQRRFIVGHNQKMAPAPTRDGVLAALKSGATSVNQIVKSTNLNRRSVATTLCTLRRRGLVNRVGWDRWTMKG